MGLDKTLSKFKRNLKKNLKNSNLRFNSSVIFQSLRIKDETKQIYNNKKFSLL